MSDPYPERPVWRIGAPVVAAVLSLAVFAVMLGSAGGVQTVALVVLLVAMAGLMLGRGLYARRTGRLVDGPMIGHQFVFWWGSMAAGYFLGTTRSTTWALIEIGIGLTSALFITWVMWLATSVDRSRAPRTRLVDLRRRPARSSDSEQ